MSNSKVELKNPWAAAILAYLIPGTGHLYQGRIFKGVLYSVCILGSFFWGLHLGDWKIVYYRWEPDDRRLGYLSQVLVGLPALPALIQARRYAPLDRDKLRPDKLTSLAEGERISTLFKGRLKFSDSPDDDTVHQISGRIELQRDPESLDSRNVRGVFSGVLNDEASTELQLSRNIVIGPKLCASAEITHEDLRIERDGQQKVFSSGRRYLKCGFNQVTDGQVVRTGVIEGTIPRSFWDWFEVPLEEEASQNLHGTLDKFFGLAEVFTWIAGLLNLLAIWDALEGPAYGYGDEEDEQEGNKSDKETREKSQGEKTAAAEPAEKSVAATPKS